MAQEMDVRQPKLLAELVNLCGKSLDSPQRRVVRLVRTSTPQLIVEDNLSISSKGFKRLEIVVAGTGSSVQQYQRDSAATNAPIPDSTAFNADRPFGLAQSSEARANLF